MVLPDGLAAVAAGLLGDARVHDPADPVGAAERAAADPDATALIGPFHSRDVAEVVEVTAPRRLPVLAPAATWAGVTRDDEPGCEDAARHLGTVFRMVARDTEVARRVAAFVGEARVIAGAHDYARQLESQLTLAGLRDAPDAEVVVLCALAGDPEVEAAASTGLPVIAFDGIQGAPLPDLRVALAYPGNDLAWGVRRAAALAPAGPDLDAIRALGPFDEHGDPVDAPVELWRGDGLERAL